MTCCLPFSARHCSLAAGWRIWHLPLQSGTGTQNVESTRREPLPIELLLIIRTCPLQAWTDVCAFQSVQCCCLFHLLYICKILPPSNLQLVTSTRNTAWITGGAPLPILRVIISLKKYQDCHPYGLLVHSLRIKFLPFSKFLDEPFPRNRVSKLQHFLLHSYVVTDFGKMGNTHFSRFFAHGSSQVRCIDKSY